MSKDRAAPFSRKHRRYWIPVTGGMILIGVINVALGLCTYKDAPEPQRMEVQIARDAGNTDAAGTLGARDVPVAVIRAFNTKYPRTLPSGARKDGDSYTLGFGVGKTATFTADGTFVSEH